MAKVTKNIVDKDLRDTVFGELMGSKDGWDAESAGFHRINDRQYGILLTDLNGHQRYVRIGAIVAEEREDMTAEELMQSEIDTYNQKQADKAEKAKAKAEKIAKDKVKRETESKTKEGEQV